MPCITITMKFETIFDKHTDIISDKQWITTWSFDIDALKNNPDSGDYSAPVRRALFKAFAILSGSGDIRLRERSFTVFMGDHGPEFRYFAVGIRDSTFRGVKDILYSEFSRIEGFMYETRDRMPYIALIPFYRYIHGRIIEYTFDDELAGKKYVDEYYQTGLNIRYRMWISAETCDVKEKYISKG